MTERQGAFTVSTKLFLSTEQRARLERLVWDQHMDVAELISMIVADHCESLPNAIAVQHQGAVTIPTLLFLTPEAREEIEQVTHERKIDLANLVSYVVGEYLDTLPD